MKKGKCHSHSRVQDWSSKGSHIRSIFPPIRFMLGKKRECCLLELHEVRSLYGMQESGYFKMKIDDELMILWCSSRKIREMDACRQLLQFRDPLILSLRQGHLDHWKWLKWPRIWAGKFHREFHSTIAQFWNWLEQNRIDTMGYKDKEDPQIFKPKTKTHMVGWKVCQTI